LFVFDGFTPAAGWPRYHAYQMNITNICPLCGNAVTGAEAEWFEKYAQWGAWYRANGVPSDISPEVLAAFHPDCAKRLVEPSPHPPK
jgi:hypothetical protein